MQCKTWNGPVCSIEELQSILSQTSDAVEQIVKTELSCYKERLSNLCILLNGQSEWLAVLPTNKDALKVIRNVDVGKEDENEDVLLEKGQICVTLWKECVKEIWYLGYCKDINEEDGTYTIDHLHDINNNLNLKWKYPSKGDVTHVEDDQIQILGDWNVSSDRNNEYILQNPELIHKKFFLDVKHLI